MAVLLVVLISLVVSCSCSFRGITVHKDSEQLVSVEAIFGPKDFEPINCTRLLYVEEEDCSNWKFSQASTQFLKNCVLVERRGCSYTTKANEAQKLGAVAMVVINEEYEEGLLFPMMATFKNIRVQIPCIMMTQGGGQKLKSMLEVDPSESITITAETDHSLGTAWTVYWWLCFILFSLLVPPNIGLLVAVCRSKHTWNMLLQQITVLLTPLLFSIDFLSDHWNLNGSLPRVVSQLLVSSAIFVGLPSFLLFGWHWYTILQEKKLVSDGGKWKNASLPIFIILLVIPLLLDIMKLSFVAAGYTYRFSIAFYSTGLSVWCIGVSVLVFFNGWKLRKKIRSLFRNKKSAMFRTGFVTYVGCFGVLIISFSLAFWSITPSIFGVWTWPIFHFFWRISEALYTMMASANTGYQLFRRHKDSTSLTTDFSFGSIEMEEKPTEEPEIKLIAEMEAVFLDPVATIFVDQFISSNDLKGLNNSRFFLVEMLKFENLQESARSGTAWIMYQKYLEDKAYLFVACIPTGEREKLKEIVQESMEKEGASAIGGDVFHSMKGTVESVLLEQFFKGFLSSIQYQYYKESTLLKTRLEDLVL